MSENNVTFTILGEPASKANSRKLVRFGNRPAFIKSDKARNYLALFKNQVPQLKELLEGDLVVYIQIYYSSRRPDLDASVILDAMEGYIYKNDRQVREQHLYWGLDKTNPRSIISIGKRCSRTLGTNAPQIEAFERILQDEYSTGDK